jgi:hypothetical protein
MPETVEGQTRHPGSGGCRTQDALSKPTAKYPSSRTEKDEGLGVVRCVSSRRRQVFGDGIDNEGRG